MQRVALRVLQTESHLQLVLPAESLLVVIVGLQRDGAEHRVVALAALVPVVRHVVLEQLQRVVTRELPEVRLSNEDIHRRLNVGVLGLLHHLLYKFRLRRHTLLIRIDYGTYKLELPLGVAYEVGAIHVYICERIVLLVAVVLQ